MKIHIPLHGREGVKELREHLEHVPPRTRGDFRGVNGNPHQVLIQQWLPPSSPPLKKRGDNLRPTRFCKDSRIFSHLHWRKGMSCVAGMALETRRTPHYTFLNRGDFQENLFS
ncbi:MAG: hypothetical protein DMG06_18870 [Acidobacteria bacterium]|nr:MAG: hypothetical protein DMG06_18870 [Acidobacteriota bacterium]